VTYFKLAGKMAMLLTQGITFNDAPERVTSVAFKSANEPSSDPTSVQVNAYFEDGTYKDVGVFYPKFNGRWDLTQKFFFTDHV